MDVLQFREIMEGDTLKSRDGSFSAAPDASPLASILMRFARPGTSETLEVAGSVLNAAAWQFRIPAVSPCPLSPGVWYWVIRGTAVNGTVLTVFQGTQTVLDDPTKIP